MTRQEELQYGFQIGDSQAKSLFEIIPIYPKTMTTKELAIAFGVETPKISTILWKLPPLAPVIQDFGIISRTK